MAVYDTEWVLTEVEDERARQDSRWGEQSHPDGTGHAHFMWAASNHRISADANAASGSLTWADILLEEVYEALAESDQDNLLTELIQVAAVAAAWAECIMRRPVAEVAA